MVPVVRLTVKFGNIRVTQSADNSLARSVILALDAVGLFVVKIVTSCA